MEYKDFVSRFISKRMELRENQKDSNDILQCCNCCHVVVRDMHRGSRRCPHTMEKLLKASLILIPNPAVVPAIVIDSAGPTERNLPEEVGQSLTPQLLETRDSLQAMLNCFRTRDEDPLHVRKRNTLTVPVGNHYMLTTIN